MREPDESEDVFCNTDSARRPQSAFETNDSAKAEFLVARSIVSQVECRFGRQVFLDGIANIAERDPDHAPDVCHNIDNTDLDSSQVMCSFFSLECLAPEIHVDGCQRHVCRRRVICITVSAGTREWHLLLRLHGALAATITGH